MLFFWKLVWLPKRCWNKRRRLLLFFLKLSSSFCSSMTARYRQNRTKSKKDKNCLISCQSERHLVLREETIDRFLSISSCMKARSMLGLRVARDFSTRNLTDFGTVRWAMLALRKAVLERKVRILPRNLINLFKHLRCWSLYRWRKYLKRRLVVQNLKMAWSRRFIPKLFVWHFSRDIVRMKWRYYRAGLYTEKKRSQDVIWTSSKRWNGQPMESSRV